MQSFYSFFYNSSPFLCDSLSLLRGRMLLPHKLIPRSDTADIGASSHGNTPRLYGGDIQRRPDSRCFGAEDRRVDGSAPRCRLCGKTI